MKPDELPPLRHCLTGELVGTFILIFFGLGAVHSAVLMGALAGVWQIAIVWGVAIMLAIHAVGAISGAHINPAITVAMYCWDGFRRERVLPYIVAQVLGAFLAAACLYTMFSPALREVEQRKGVVRGKPGSEITATCYGEYFPAPGGLASGDEPYSPEEHAALKKTVTHGIAFFAETLGTALLTLMVFALGDQRNRLAALHNTAGVFIGLTVAILICVIAPLTQACFNPARDFGPRIFAALAGWGKIALPLGTDWGWLTVYIVAPTLGAVIGGGFYKKILQPMYDTAR